MDLGERLSDWDKEITLHLASGGRPRERAGLVDFGTDAGIPDPPNVGKAYPFEPGLTRC